MMLGLSLPAFTALHVVISLVAIAAAPPVSSPPAEKTPAPGTPPETKTPMSRQPWVALSSRRTGSCVTLALSTIW